MESSLNCFMQIKNAEQIAIIVHNNADTDAVASAISLRRIIKDNFETDNKKYIVDIFSDTCVFNAKDEDLIKNEEINKQNCKKYDLAIALDCSSRARLGLYDKIFKRAKDTLNIDHHITNERFAKNNIVSPKCSSTCEIIYLLFIQINKLSCSSNTLSVIYSGIITDTNNLTQNIGPKTFNVINSLNKLTLIDEIDLEKVRNHFFKNNTKEQNALLSRALKSLNYSNDGKIAMMKITKTDFNQTHTSISDTLGIVDHAINTQGVEIGVIFIRQLDNTYYVSLRSKNQVNVGEIAKQMGGGGHDKVAAFQTKKTEKLKQIKTKLVSLCHTQINQASESEDEDISTLFSEVVGDGPEEEQDE